MFLKPDTRRSNTFFDDYLEIWMDAFIGDRKARGYSKATIGFYLDKLKLFSKYADGVALKQIGDISPQLIREYLLWLDGRGHTVGGIHAAGRSATGESITIANGAKVGAWLVNTSAPG